MILLKRNIFFFNLFMLHKLKYRAMNSLFITVAIVDLGPISSEGIHL